MVVEYGIFMIICFVVMYINFYDDLYDDLFLLFYFRF